MYEAVANSAEVIAGVLGIAVTVVAIIVELAATRYNHRITDLFIREPLNFFALSYFVATTLMCVWVGALSASDGMVWIHRVTMAMITLALLLLLPYFVYVLSFISPNNVIRRISKRAFREMVRCSNHYSARRRAAVMRGLDEMQDVLRSAVERGDRDIAIGCVDSMADLLRSYQQTVLSLPDVWYELDTSIQQDPEFVSLEPSALVRIEQNRTWFEHKVFSLLLKSMRLCSSQLTDVANQIFIRTRQLALEQQHPSKHFELSLSAFNSYLRSNITSQDLRSAYFGLNQYRKVAEELVDRGCHVEVLTVIQYLREYGQLAFRMRQPFLLGACAYDLLQLLRKSVGTLDEVVDNILEALLTLDEELRTERNETTLHDVRRAQVQAAVVLLVAGQAARADRVIADLAGEAQIGIDRLIVELQREQREDFWELTPLGVNFLYLTPEERAQLDTVNQRLSAQGQGS